MRNILNRKKTASWFIIILAKFMPTIFMIVKRRVKTGRFLIHFFQIMPREKRLNPGWKVINKIRVNNLVLDMFEEM
jgi:hypothetical protein